MPTPRNGRWHTPRRIDCRLSCGARGNILLHSVDTRHRRPPLLLRHSLALEEPREMLCGPRSMMWNVFRLGIFDFERKSLRQKSGGHKRDCHQNRQRKTPTGSHQNIKDFLVDGRTCCVQKFGLGKLGHRKKVESNKNSSKLDYNLIQDNTTYSLYHVCYSLLLSTYYCSIV
jgi:hypothetical protein